MTAPPLPQQALARLLTTLVSASYRFTTPTPLTHQRVLSRPAARQSSTEATLRAIFGWSQPFEPTALPADLLCLLLTAGIVVHDHDDAAGRLKSTIRVSSLGDDLFVHSAFPTRDGDAVFFGPDTYRFARFIAQSLPGSWCAGEQPCRVLDIGCGSGAGGVAVERALGTACALVLNDINPRALAYAAVNASAAGVSAALLPGDAMTEVDDEFDVIVANPPYLDDDHQRAYRHGGARLGRALSLSMAATALAHLAPGGSLLLYTGVAMVDGKDPFLQELAELLAGFDGAWTYSEIDPDVFGEELERPVYAHIDRIAAVGLTVRRRQIS